MLFKGLFFEYFYYRLYHRAREEGQYKGFQGACIIAVVQSTLLGDIFLLTQSYFNYFPLKHISGFGTVAGIATLALAIYNFKKYDKRMEEFNARWEPEDADQRFIKGIIMVVTIFAPFLSLILFYKAKPL
jgi:hypothetical protein